jgi:hypothetical protein
MTVRSLAGLVLAAAVTVAPALALATPASAQSADARPVAYINADRGKETDNPDVPDSSECETPVQTDTQPLGDEASGTGNVHVDACLFGAGDERIDMQAAFTVSGVGTISGCPDPDKEGPQTSTKTGNSCVLSNFEADNSEYHVRVVSATAGLQTVTFCADPEGDGCGNASSTSVLRVTWGAPTGGVAAGGSSAPFDGPVTAPALVALGAFAAAGAALTVAMRGARR